MENVGGNLAIDTRNMQQSHLLLSDLTRLVAEVSTSQASSMVSITHITTAMTDVFTRINAMSTDLTRMTERTDDMDATHFNTVKVAGSQLSSLTEGLTRVEVSLTSYLANQETFPTLKQLDAIIEPLRTNIQAILDRPRGACEMQRNQDIFGDMLNTLQDVHLMVAAQEDRHIEVVKTAAAEEERREIQEETRKEIARESGRYRKSSADLGGNRTPSSTTTWLKEFAAERKLTMIFLILLALIGVLALAGNVTYFTEPIKAYKSPAIQQNITIQKK